MNKQFRVFCFISVMAIPGLAAAQSTTAFDGTYAGVSNTGGGSCSPFMTVPRPVDVAMVSLSSKEDSKANQI